MQPNPYFVQKFPVKISSQKCLKIVYGENSPDLVTLEAFLDRGNNSVGLIR
jgi:hypothetical protein